MVLFFPFPLRTFSCIGLQRWEQARNEWLAMNRSGAAANTSSASNSDDSSFNTPRPTAVPLEVDEIIDVIFSPRWRGGGMPAPAAAVEQNGETESTTTASTANDLLDPLTRPPRRFPTNVPLPQMVDVLVDLWEAEGLDM